MNNPFDYTPNEECENAFRKLTDRLEILKGSDHPDDVNFCHELEEGKMLGVLIATDTDGNHHTLYAFSGQIGSGGFYYSGFVGPVFDYLRPDGYFKAKEKEITHLNIKIKQFQEESLTRIIEEYELTKNRLTAKVSEFKEKIRLSKLERDSKREAGNIGEAEKEALIRCSQFEKAELHRLKKRVAAELYPSEIKLKEAQSYLNGLKRKRRSDSEALQNWLFSNSLLLNARGETGSLSEIFADTPMRIPPSGSGECCAPKLLQAAYLKGWRPVAIAEYWYGKSKEGEVRIHGSHYSACRGKCLPILRWMLQSLTVDPPIDSEYQDNVSFTPEIIYENKWFCVVNKPGGMLSVPGKGTTVSVQQWLSDKYGVDREVKVAHRLDRDTSGLLIATFGQMSFKVMQSLFATRKIKKTYIADLEGNYQLLNIPVSGRIKLPLSPDWLDRPRQRIDFDGGKESVTDFEFITTSEGCSRIIFYPLTGRTHQLRVHSASELGLSMPILGDRLYGRKKSSGSERLHLHAQKIEFTFPLDGHNYSFDSPVPF